MKKIKLLSLTLLTLPNFVLAEKLTQSSYTNVKQLIVSIINFVLGFAGALALLFIIIGGIQYITSAGNEDKVTTAKKTLLYAIMGIIAIAFALLILNLVNTKLRSFV